MTLPVPVMWMMGKYPPHGPVGAVGLPQFVNTLKSHVVPVTAGPMLFEKFWAGSVIVALAASCVYVTSPYTENELSASVGSLSTGGFPIRVGCPLVETFPSDCVRMPALAESSGGHPAHPVGAWSFPSMLALPTTTSAPPEVTAAWVLTCRGRIRARSPIRWLAPPPRMRPARLMVSWAVMSIMYSWSLSLYISPL